jgi:hypothetical protein
MCSSRQSSKTVTNGTIHCKNAIKFMKKLFAIVLLHVTSAGTVFAQNKAPSVAPTTSKFQCTSTPCGNTATGEDPSDIAEREGGKKLEEMRNTASDRQRWGATSLYSSAKQEKDLQVDVLKAISLYTTQLASSRSACKVCAAVMT